MERPGIYERTFAHGVDVARFRAGARRCLKNFQNKPGQLAAAGDEGAPCSSPPRWCQRGWSLGLVPLPAPKRLGFTLVKPVLFCRRVGLIGSMGLLVQIRLSLCVGSCSPILPHRPSEREVAQSLGWLVRAAPRGARAAEAHEGAQWGPGWSWHAPDRCPPWLNNRG